MIKIRISGTIEISDYPPQLASALKKALTIDNPTYHRNKRMGIKVWESLRWYKYYKEKDGVLIIPRGFRSRLIRWIEKCGYEYTAENNLINVKL